MKYILILFFVIGCESKPVGKIQLENSTILDTAMIYVLNSDGTIADSIIAYPDNFPKIFNNLEPGKTFMIKMMPSLDTPFDVDDYYEKPDTFLIYKETVLPNGYSLSGKGMGKTVYKLVDTTININIKGMMLSDTSWD